MRRPNLPGANCSTEGGNIPLESPGWTASCQTLLMPEITQPHTGRFDALFSSSPVQGITSRRGDHTERLLTFPKRRVGWLHDTIGGFPSNVSFPSPSPHPTPHNIFLEKTAGSIPAHAQDCGFGAKVPPYPRSPSTSELPPRTRPINPPANEMMPFHARTAV